jgi:hypothetical protein
MKKKKELSRYDRFVEWLVGVLCPEKHLAKNPPRGLKRVRKEKEV